MVLRAAEYRASMLQWLRTGSGPESRPGETAAAHGKELALYLLAALATLNAAAIALGAVLLNYMNAYVARIWQAAIHPLAYLLAWNVWSLVRVAGYILLGVACAGPMATVAGVPAGRGHDDSALSLAITGAVLVVLDLVLKLALSKPMGRLLSAAVDLDAAAGTRPAVR